MLMQCKIVRPGGTQITLNGTTYDFQPDEHGRHVCEMTDEDHIERLLHIPEGYRAVLDSAPASVPAQTEAPTGDVLAPAIPEGSDDEGPGSFDGEGDSVDTEGDTVDEGEIDLEELSDEDLDTEYEHVIGSKPNANAKRETKIKRIREAVEE